MRIQKLKLSTFRNISQASISHIGGTHNGEIIALIGSNGAGKTSILEALSLISPGKGLHKASPKEIAQLSKNNSAQNFAVFAELSSENTVGIGLKESQKRTQINGIDTQKQAELTNLGNVLWLTPRQDRIFLDGPAPRRDLIDRLTFGLIPSHAEAVARYKYHTKNRLKLLQRKASLDWIALEEMQAAAAGIQVLQNRNDYLTALQPFLEDISLSQQGATLDVLKEEVPETALQGKFERSRERDTITNSTNTGAMKVDLSGTLNLEGQKIALHQTSSGQHKRALIDLTLAHAKLIKAKTEEAPLILLDEFTAHLDQKRQEYLLTQLTTLGAQIWLTDVDFTPYAHLPNILKISVENGQINQ